MDRRTFLKSGAAATASAGIGAASTATAGPTAETQSPLALKTILAPRFMRGYLRDRADRFALRLKEMTNGRITLDLVAAPSSVSAMTQVRNGNAYAYFGSEADHVGDHPGLAYFSGLPGDLSLAPEHFATWLSAGGGQLYWDDIAADFGVKSFAVGHSGRRSGLWSTGDIGNLAELSGLRAEVSGVAAYVAKRLGVTLHNTGDTDHADLVEPLMGAVAWLADNRPAQRHRVWFRDGFYRDGVALSFGLAHDVWEYLGPADQAIVTACANEAYYQNLAEHDAHDSAVAPHLFKMDGIQKRTLPDAIIKAMAHVTSELLNEWQASDSGIARIHTSHMQFRQNVTGLSKDVLTSAAFVS